MKILLTKFWNFPQKPRKVNVVKVHVYRGIAYHLLHNVILSGRETVQTFKVIFAKLIKTAKRMSLKRGRVHEICAGIP